jgi:hypothetical protein
MNKKYTILLLAIAAIIAYPVIAQNTQGVQTNNPSADVSAADTVQTTSMPNGGVISGPAPSAGVAASLALSRTYLNANYVAAGIGVRNTGRGTISLRVPRGASLTDAWIYWKILNTTAGPHDNEITVNGIRTKGTLIGSGVSPCWSGNGFTYKANIASILSSTSITGGEYGIVIGGINSAITDGSGAWQAFALPSAEDAQAVIIFKDPANPTSAVTILDGYNEVPGGSFTASVPVGARMFSSLIGDGQVVGITPFSKAVSYKAGSNSAVVTLQKVTLNGKDPSITSRATYQGSLSDTDTYILPSVATSGATLTWSLATDCVAYDGLIFSNATAVP